MSVLLVRCHIFVVKHLSRLFSIPVRMTFVLIFFFNLFTHSVFCVFWSSLMHLEHTNSGIDPDSLMSSTIVTHTNGDFIYNLLTVCTNYIKTLKTAVFKKKKDLQSIKT